MTGKSIGQHGGGIGVAELGEGMATPACQVHVIECYVLGYLPRDTEREYASVLAKRPYDLRHACVSTWLAAGVPSTQVAEWAGHSVAVLQQIYAKVIAGTESSALDLIGQALGLPPAAAEPNQEDPSAPEEEAS